MDIHSLPYLLGWATLLPLVSFGVILLFGPRLGLRAAYVATGAIALAGVLSFVSLFLWLGAHWPADAHHGGEHGAGHDGKHAAVAHDGLTLAAFWADDKHADDKHADDKHADDKHADETRAGAKEAGHQAAKPAYSGVYYVLGKFQKLELNIGYYIDSLTVVMFCMVTFIASCIHFYAIGYMHDELEKEYVDHEAHDHHGHHLHRPGRFHRFFQYLSLFCFSMLGLVLAGNIAMVFVFWELVGICSYFLIGFYVERQSASTAANKAFIVNRVGDFGMIIGLMALWSALGTFSFGDTIEKTPEGARHVRPGIFTLVRQGPHHTLKTPAGFVAMDASEKMAALHRGPAPKDAASRGELEKKVEAEIDALRDQPKWTSGFLGWLGKGGHGYWLLVVAGIGIFCGCVGKSAQFPLHTWLPDAMEGPTPVSALVHSATMVAAGVYLVGRFYPVFTPEVLLVIACVGTITLFMAATIAIVATDIKRVLAYSTISQLGYMMMALGVGGWKAGLTHLVTHAFFKSLLFLCSGSVIHAVHTNDMNQMGGLLKKMPYTGWTMLVGCLAISGAGIPLLFGLSGFHSKDMILEQAYSYMTHNGALLSAMFFCVAALSAGITAFYMFRLWFLTFLGEPRNHDRYHHAHESPKVMYVPLVVLATLAVIVAWPVPFTNLGLDSLLEQARPEGTALESDGKFVATPGKLVALAWPNEHASHAWSIKVPVSLAAFGAALAGVALAAAFYWKRYFDAGAVRHRLRPLHDFLRNKWWFDELYDLVFVRPTFFVAHAAANCDRSLIDGLIDGLAWTARNFARSWTWLGDTLMIDGAVDRLAKATYDTAASLRDLQTGSLRQYVMFIVFAAVMGAGVLMLLFSLLSPGASTG